MSDLTDTAVHGAKAVADAVTGDWDGAANEAQSMAGSAIGVATGGISTALEDVYDGVAPKFGLPDSHQVGHDVLQAAGNAIGDGMTHLVHGAEDIGNALGDAFGGAASDLANGGGMPTGLDPDLGGGLDGGLGGDDLADAAGLGDGGDDLADAAGLGDGGDGGYDPSMDGGDGGYDPSMDGGDMSGGDGSY